MARWLRVTLLLGVPMLFGPFVVQRKVSAKRVPKSERASPAVPGGEPLPAKESRLQTVVDTIRERLAIAEAVSVTLVPSNRLIVSVERHRDRAAGFVMSMEDTFVAQLSDVELEAVIAHELGHVWIYTHHPYLQTEEGANEVALKVVDRQTLTDVYEKVWSRIGERGSLRYLPVE